MNSVNLEREFPELQPNILEIAAELQSIILRIFPAVEITRDEENVGFGFGSGYKDLVFGISPFRENVNLGIVNGATLEDHVGLMQGTGKVHRHVKLQIVEQVQDPDLEQLMLRALQVAQKTDSKGHLTPGAVDRDPKSRADELCISGLASLSRRLSFIVTYKSKTLSAASHHLLPVSRLLQKICQI